MVRGDEVHHSTIVVQRAALLSLEQTLGEVDLGRFAKIAERKAHPGLDVAGALDRRPAATVSEGLRELADALTGDKRGAG